MTLNLPYKILSAGLVAGAGFFIASPVLSLNTLADKIVANDTVDWSARVNTENLLPYSKAILEGQLKVKLFNDKQSGHFRSAYEDYNFALGSVDRQAKKLVTAKGFKHFVCGELARFPDLPAKADSGCWMMDASISWQSLTEVKATFVNPETQWQSVAVFKRLGLFNWQLDSVELPVEAMIARLDKQLKAAGSV